MDIGARWIRAALQVNPFSYEGRNAPASFFADERQYNSALLDECEKLGITLIAITDHWRVDSALELSADAEARGIVALPGFEANSSEGIHILVLFEAKTPVATINAAIGRCGAVPGCANGTTGDSYATIMERMTADGALPIPAHVNTEPAGLLTTRSGQPLAKMILNPDLHAIGVSPGAEPTKDQEAVVRGTGIFERTHPLAVIHADDVMGPRQLRDAGASSWFKVSSLSLQSLKLAVRTPQTRVSLTDPSAQPRPRIKAVSWVGGYLDGVSVPISSDLTALIGGRGAGKSTVIESIRYALAIRPISEQMAKDHGSIVTNVLNTGTIVRLEVESVTPTVQAFTIQREVPHPPVVLDASGEHVNLTPADVVDAVEVFGQHELAELAGDSEGVAELVRRFDGSGGEDPALAELRGRLRTNREDLHRAETDMAALQEKQEQAARLEEQLGHYEETDVPGKLRGHERLDQDEAVFKEGSARVVAVEKALDQYCRSSALAELGASFEDIESAPQAERLARVTATLGTVRDALTDLNRQAAEIVQAAREEIKAVRADWSNATAQERESYGEVLRDLAERGLDPGKYITAKQNLTDLNASKPRLKSKAEEIKDLLKNRAVLVGELRAHETVATERLHDAIRSANEATGGVVVVKPATATDRTHVMDVIRNRVSGQKGQISAAVNDPAFSPQGLASAIRDGSDALARLDIKGAQAANLVDAGEELARELEELTVAPAVEVLLLVDGAQGLRSMDQLSKGQRATALLLLLLGASDAPLIIDQPEDDLDNNFVYQGVVKHLRELKGKRQVIASTHNANVPVLGDAELIVVLESDGSHGKPAANGVGSLDDRAIRSLVENILEGGPAAFNARHHLYGF